MLTFPPISMTRFHLPDDPMNKSNIDPVNQHPSPTTYSFPPEQTDRTINPIADILQLSQDNERSRSTFLNGLRMISSFAEELFSCSSIDTLYRRAVELARTKLGLERCSIFLWDNNRIYGTYGTDRNGKTSDEKTLIFDIDNPFSETNNDSQSASTPAWTLMHATRTEWDGMRLQFLEPGWIAVTRIQTPAELIGYFYNDTAISNRECDIWQQEVVAAYCALLGIVITQKRLEESLRETERLFRRAIEVAEAVPYQLDYKTNSYKFIGDGITKLTGYDPSELTPDLMNEITTEDYLTGELSKYKIPDAIQLVRSDGGVTWRSDFKIQTKIGQTHWLTDAAIQVKDEYGNIVGSLGILQDITNRKKVEDEKFHLEEQLRHSQKMEAVGQLAGGVAHEFNNLLQAILGYTDLAMVGMDETESRYQKLDFVRKAANRAAILTRQLLAFSRRQMVKPTLVDLNTLIDEHINMLRRIIKEDIRQVIDLNPLPLSIYADSVAIEQILLNLCLNAQDAMPQGGELRISTSAVTIDSEFCAHFPNTRPGCYGLLSVSDNGMGMTPEILERIFEPFFTTKEVGKGTGLGLAMVYGFVEQHNGFILAESKPGLGSTFKVYLPLSNNPPQEIESTNPFPSLRGNETILVAEDEQLVRDYTCAVLREQGYTVISAKNGNEALKLFEANMDSIQLLVLDVVMPECHGSVVFETIRDEKPSIPVIFCSGYNTAMSSLANFSTANVRFIEKPFRAEVLLEAIRQSLDATNHSHPQV